ncbi:MAG: hypothetical protein GF408_08815 [Candidatus Omnitrophica bacterium]|nr:hypothetical protein [Candidatus Omnitrophota bacterium]
MIAYLLILLGILLRLVPHAANMAPVAAIALFAGAYLDRRIAPWVPLAIMVASDLVIGLHDVVFYTWGAFLLTGFMGVFTLREKRTPARVMGVTAGASILFFLITNFGVWLAWYPRTFAGLADCYVKALPFIRNTLASNLIAAAVLFGVYELLARTVKKPVARKVLFAGSA